MLEDIATDRTKFIEGAINFRYLSNGILNEKLKESNEALIEYVKSVYEFKKPDLKYYFFLLKKDIYSWVLEYISTYNLLEFIRLFNDINFKHLNQDILGDIYEHYLEQEKVTDKKSYRKLLGQYYTPKPIVRLMWLLVRNVLKKEKNRDLYEKNKPCLNILDPAYGSGTFLVEAILQSNQSALKKTINEKGKIFGFINDRGGDKKIEENLFGFELNPLSKSIADINLFFGLTEAYGADRLKPFPIKTIKLYRTDSYDLDYDDITEDKESEQMSVMHLFSEEIKNTIEEHSEIIKAKQQKYDIIIANPPYGHTKPNKFMKEQLIPFAYAENNFNKKGEEISFNWKTQLRKGEVPKFEKNRGKLYDNYGFFFGVADKLLKENGIICFITSNTYLSLPTYKWTRKYWLDNYTIHYIINFNKVGELHNSVFIPEADISTAIILLEKKKNIQKKTIKFLSLEKLPLTEKYNYICDSIKWVKPAKNKNHIKRFTIKNITEFQFEKLLIEDILNDLDYVFLIKDEIIKKIETDSFILGDLLKTKLGNKTGKNTLFINPDEKVLKKQISKFLETHSYKLRNYNKEIKKYNNKLMENSSHQFAKNIEEKIDKYLTIKGDKKELKKEVDLEYNEKNVKDIIVDIEPFVATKNAKMYYDFGISLSCLDSSGPREFIFKEFFEETEIKLILRLDRYKGIKAFVDSNNNFCINSFRVGLKLVNENINFLKSREDFLYYICCILNSKILKYYIAKRGIPVYSDYILPIKKISEKNVLVVKKVISKTKLIHKLKSDQNKFFNNKIDFVSDWFRNEIFSKIEIVNILENSKEREVLFSNEMTTNYYVEKASCILEEIILNDDIKIVCKTKEMAKAIFNKYLKNYEGNLQEKEILINKLELFEHESYLNLLQQINDKCNQVENEINDLVLDIYGISKEEKEKINQEIYQTDMI
jgi:hypothetical protein